MSKNLTRKSLAFGALIALGSSVFAGAPAFAGVETAKITLAPKAGTTYTTIIGSSFEFANEIDLTIESDGLENKDAEDLTYLVTNASLQSIELDLDNHAAAATGYGDSTVNVKGMSGDTTDLATYEAASTTYKSKKKVIAVTGSNLQSADTADQGKNYLKVTTSTDSTDPFSITVQAFLDDNNNGEIDTFEATSAVRTLSFIKASAVTTTTTVTSAVTGGTSLKGTIVLGNDVNMKNLVGTAGTNETSQVQIKFFKNGSVRKMKIDATHTQDSVDVDWDSDNSYLTNTSFNTVATQDSTDKVAEGTYTAKAYFKDAAGNFILLGAESAGVSAEVSTNKSADNTDWLVATSTTDVIRASGTATTVRTGFTGAVTLNTRVLQLNNTTDSAPWEEDTAVEIVKTAGLKVRVTLTKGATFGTGHEVTAGGVKLTSTSGPVTYIATTDVDGKIKVAATSNKGTKGDSYVVKTQVLTETGWEATGDSTTVTFADATLSSSSLVLLNKVGYANSSAGELSVAKGGSVTLNYELRDNYGALSTVAGTYRVSVSSTSTGGGSVTGTAAISGGKASFTFTDNTVSSTGSLVVTGALQKLNTAGDAYAAEASASAAVTVNVGTAAVTGITVPSDATAGIALEYEDFVNHDLRLDANTKTWAGLAFTGGAFTVTGTATSASGAIVPGATVTISAKGLQFVAANSSTNADAKLATDSISVQANASGVYSVTAYSHIAGDVKIAVASGSATKTVLAKFTSPAAADKDSKLTISGATTTKSGRSTGYVIALTDKFGNAIKKTGGETIKVEQTGAGYLTSAPTTVSAVDGKTNVTLITQPADAGLTTLTVTFDVANSDTDVVVKKEILVGVSASITKAATSKVTIKNAAGLVVKVVRGTKSATKTATSDSYKVSLKGGKGTVSVYVNGVKVASK